MCCVRGINVCVELLIDAYGIGDVTPGHPTPLPAPQASLMRAVTYSIFYESMCCVCFKIN